MPLPLRRILLGFIIGAIAVLVGHQVVALVLYATGAIPNPPYSLRPTGALGIPTILNQMFWGGIWGAVFAALLPTVPRRWPLLMVGIAFGLLGPLVLGNWLLVPLFRGQPLFAVTLAGLWRGALILGVFGLVWAYLYRLAEGRFR